MALQYLDLELNDACAILAQGLRWGNFPTTHPMAEIKEITNMNTAFHMDEQRTLAHAPYKEGMTIGRSTGADYRIEGTGVSNFHVYLKRGKNAQGATIFMATDVSLNGTGVVSEDRPATEKKVPVILPEGSSLLIPMRASGQHRQGEGPHIL